MVATSAKRLGRAHVVFVERTGVGPEQVERTDDRAPQSHRQCVRRLEAGVERDGRESGPAFTARSKVIVHDQAGVAVAVDARPFVGLQLEQLDDAHGLARGGDDAEIALRRAPA